MLWVTQIGTVVCWKTEVPQTGKAVEGVCPGVVQVCAEACVNPEIKQISIKRFLIIGSLAVLYLSLQISKMLHMGATIYYLNGI